MGYYIDPPLQSKEEWLATNGIEVPDPHMLGDNIEDMYGVLSDKHNVPVCLVQNHSFSAAGIAVNIREFRRFVLDISGRQKRWFTVARKNIRQIHPELKGIV